MVSNRTKPATKTAPNTSVHLTYEDAANLRNLLQIVNSDKENRKAFGRCLGLTTAQMTAIENRVAKNCKVTVLCLPAKP
jgi:hypothetical protein